MPAKKVALTPAAVRAAINKRYPGSVKMASDPSLQIERIPSGSLAINALLNGGYSRKRHVEVYGSASVGKTTLAYLLIAMVQRLGGRAAMVDAEGTFDPVFAAWCGVNVSELEIHEQVHGPRCVDVMKTWLMSGLYDVVVLDSIAALLPLYEHENSMEAGSMGMEQAKLMSKAMRNLTAANRKSVIFYINQTREKVEKMFGNNVTTSAGRAMGFYAGTRLELVRTETMKDTGDLLNQKTGELTRGDVAVGHRIQVRVKKDKTGSAREGATTTLVFDYDLKGFDEIEDLIYLGRLYGLVHMKKSKKVAYWWVDDYEKHKIKGRKAFKKFLKGKGSEIAAELRQWIINTIEDDDEEED